MIHFGRIAVPRCETPVPLRTDEDTMNRYPHFAHFSVSSRSASRLLAVAATLFLGQWMGELPAAMGQSSVQEKPDADREASELKYLRVVRDPSGQPAALQTALTRFRDRERGVIVDLIGAVHIGEADYYRQLSDQFELYDRVLYELVADESAPRPDGQPRPTTHPIALLQQSAKSFLGLESQLESIDYRRPNFVHADLTPEELSRRLQERGETPWTLALETVLEMVQRQSDAGGELALGTGSELEDLLGLLQNPRQLKRVLAVQLADAGQLEQGLGSGLNRLLLADRNVEAIRVLKSELAAGHRHIAIFYGAAHFPDMEQRLRQELGLEPAEQVWVTAWDLRRGPQSSWDSLPRLLEIWAGAMDQ